MPGVRHEEDTVQKYIITCEHGIYAKDHTSLFPWK